MKKSGNRFRMHCRRRANTEHKYIHRPVTNSPCAQAAAKSRPSKKVCIVRTLACRFEQRTQFASPSSSLRAYVFRNVLSSVVMSIKLYERLQFANKLRTLLCGHSFLSVFLRFVIFSILRLHFFAARFCSSSSAGPRYRARARRTVERFSEFTCIYYSI